MILREIIQRVKTGYSKGASSDDVRLSDRFVYNKLLTVRSRLISQEAKKNQKVNQWNYQRIPCIKLELVPIHECPCIPAYGCQVYRSVNPIPKPLTDLNKHLIDSVTTLDGSIQYDEILFKDVRDKSGNKYTATKPDYYILNGYMYITQKSKVEVITMIALFEDPIAASTYPSYCDDIPNPCIEGCDSYLDLEFSADADTIDTMVEMAIIEVSNWFSKNIEDKSNNAADSAVQQTK